MTHDAATKSSIIALVVTYNRKEMLVECLDAILGQTVPVAEVLLIDNASTDGTHDYLEERGYLSNGRVNYHLMDTNTGGAGGFHEGMRVSRELGYDWLWLMDDDVIPAPDCLEKLLAAEQFAAQKGERVSFMASSIYGPNGEFMNVPVVDNSPSENGYSNWYRLLENGLVGISVATFVSLLIRMDAIWSCGLPCKDFFLWGDDSEYTTRLTTHYGPAFMVGNSVAIHKRANAKVLDIAYEDDPARIKNFHNVYRNQFVYCRLYKSAFKAYGTWLLSFCRVLGNIGKPHGLFKVRVCITGSVSGVKNYKHFKRFVAAELASGKEWAATKKESASTS